MALLSPTDTSVITEQPPNDRLLAQFERVACGPHTTAHRAAEPALPEPIPGMAAVAAAAASGLPARLTSAAAGPPSPELESAAARRLAAVDQLVSNAPAMGELQALPREAAEQLRSQLFRLMRKTAGLLQRVRTACAAWRRNQASCWAAAGVQHPRLKSVSSHVSPLFIADRHRGHGPCRHGAARPPPICPAVPVAAGRTALRGRRASPGCGASCGYLCRPSLLLAFWQHPLVCLHSPRSATACLAAAG